MFKTPQSSLHVVPLPDISLFLNNSGKPSSAALLKFAPVYFGYDRYASVLLPMTPYFTGASRIK